MLNWKIDSVKEFFLRDGPKEIVIFDPFAIAQVRVDFEENLFTVRVTVEHIWNYTELFDKFLGFLLRTRIKSSGAIDGEKKLNTSVVIKIVSYDLRNER